MWFFYAIMFTWAAFVLVTDSTSQTTAAAPAPAIATTTTDAADAAATAVTTAAATADAAAAITTAAAAVTTAAATADIHIHPVCPGSSSQFLIRGTHQIRHVRRHPTCHVQLMDAMLYSDSRGTHYSHYLLYLLL